MALYTSAFATLWLLPFSLTEAFSSPRLPANGVIRNKIQPRETRTTLFSDWNDDSLDSNKWKSSDDADEEEEDWQNVMGKKQDGTFWTEFESSNDASEISNEGSSEEKDADDSEAWLDTLASLQAEEVEFNMKEADRADKARQMQEWGFDSSTIESTLDIAVDASLETSDELEGMQAFREESYLDEADLALVESHTKVDKDPDSGDPVRTQMVYVDEHTCIGEPAKY